MILTENRHKKIQKVVRNRQSNFIIVLEDIHDPHNAGAIFRTCDAFGIQDVYLIFDKQKLYNPKKIGKASSSSANKWLDFKIYKSTKSCLNSLKRQGYETIATVCEDDSEDIFKTKLTAKKLALFIGNEHEGLSEYAIKHCNRKLYIPMNGMVQSLNVSVSAAICLFEISRQREKSKNEYSLDKKQQQKLLKSFEKK